MKSIAPLPLSMKAVVTTGNGGFEKLEYQDVPVPQIAGDEVLVEVLAAGVNNTEINTRIGWYSSKVTDGTQELSADEKQKQVAGTLKDGGWNETTPFPLIQGTDCCGRVIAAASNQYEHLLGSRVLIRPCIRTSGWDSLKNQWMASDFDGSFAQFVSIPASEVFPVNCLWSDAELGTIPCAYGTAENMIHRAGVCEGETVLIAGASGGVGSAAVQLAKRRGAIVTAITSKDKMDRVRALGADKVIDRSDSSIDNMGEKTMDVVIDNVAGTGFGKMIKALKRGGRYVTSGAIAGPLVELDMRDLYLKDLTLIGCTAWDEPVFPNLILYIEKGEIRPLLEKTFRLDSIIEAQKEFSLKKHVGKIVLIPPSTGI